MQVITYEQMKTALVRAAERWPDSRIVKNGVEPYTCDQGSIVVNCLVGTALHDLTDPKFAYWPAPADLPIDERAASLIREVVLLNDDGVLWRDIVLRLGLIPGEQPAEQDVVELSHASKDALANRNGEVACAVECVTDARDAMLSQA